VGGDLAGQVLGVLGLGNIGSRVATVGTAFGMKVIAWSENLSRDRAESLGAELVSREELFRRSDILTVHLILSKRTRGLIGAEELALMKPDARLVNTSLSIARSTATLLQTSSNGSTVGFECRVRSLLVSNFD
jgi:phosphoglycerate dehydrogenase-like enzyme